MHFSIHQIYHFSMTSTDRIISVLESRAFKISSRKFNMKQNECLQTGGTLIIPFEVWILLKVG